MFSVIGQGQLLMLLPEVGTEMPSLVNETFSNLDSLLLSLDFLPLESNIVYEKFEDYFGNSDDNRNLNIITEGNSVLNMFNLLVVLILIFVFHIFII